jgi:hypothetical protein
MSCVSGIRHAIGTDVGISPAVLKNRMATAVVAIHGSATNARKRKRGAGMAAMDGRLDRRVLDGAE